MRSTVPRTRRARHDVHHARIDQVAEMPVQAGRRDVGSSASSSAVVSFRSPRKAPMTRSRTGWSNSSLLSPRLGYHFQLWDYSRIW